ncbi:3-oxoacyl-[acyl-carrier-protein] reductase [Anoxybacter fermentans]|uniref:3-oxoacyl-[acyl-carrier-protein] reductase n=1 Tax=Anoxybacter fermentans TaxID=1323375 RepID=A0A3Q9HPG6_9FIRM|nr:3-oxoacyl-[acyl-carrier-protein] reductase [Anoxybacter fermentans]AZR72748.1 3-oxoacyl-[acyl-carrier-protein] reductase [Anoxybacter fermentans]
MNLNGKVAVVTGSSKGIGAAIALAYAKAGAEVAINYNRDKAGAEEIVRKIQAMGHKAKAYQADVSNPDQVKEFIDAVMNDFGKIDILVNNAGITRDTLLVRMKEEDWDRVMDVNLKSMFLCTKAVAKAMIKQRSGKIINITSVVGLIGNPGQANYTAAKAGVIGFTKTVAKELGPRGIQVNAIAPGFIISQMTESLPEKVKEKMLSSIPLGRFGKPEDVADLALFLASDKSDYITGQVFNVDGGMVM